METEAVVEVWWAGGSGGGVVNGMAGRSGQARAKVRARGNQGAAAGSEPVRCEWKHRALGAVLARVRVHRRETGEAQELLERPARELRGRAEPKAPGRFHLRDQAKLQVPSPPGCSMKLESMRK